VDILRIVAEELLFDELLPALSVEAAACLLTV
jgi:hypothetical protein